MRDSARHHALASAKPCPSRGMTLVELMIGLAVLAFLLMSGAPAFADWIRNLRVRSAAESIMSGIQSARAEAVRRNTTTRFQLTDSLDASCAPSASGLSWVVTQDRDNNPRGHCGEAQADDNGAQMILQKNTAATDVNLVTVAMDSANGAIAFNSLGQQIAVDGVAPAVRTTIDIRSPQGNCTQPGGPSGGVRCLRIEISRGGQVRMCDPGLAFSTDTQSMACQVR